MPWRTLAAAACLAVSAGAFAGENDSAGTIAFGEETFRIVHVAAHEGPMPTTVDLEFFNQPLPAGETFFSLESDVTDRLRGMRLRISEEPAYKNGTWVYPSIEAGDAFYYFDESDPIVLRYQKSDGRISGSILGEDDVAGTRVEVDLRFDLPIAAEPND